MNQGVVYLDILFLTHLRSIRWMQRCIFSIVPMEFLLQQGKPGDWLMEHFKVVKEGKELHCYLDGIRFEETYKLI